MLLKVNNLLHYFREIALTVNINIIYDILINSISEFITTAFKEFILIDAQSAIKNKIQNRLNQIL